MMLGNAYWTVVLLLIILYITKIFTPKDEVLWDFWKWQNILESGTGRKGGFIRVVHNINEMPSLNRACVVLLRLE